MKKNNKITYLIAVTTVATQILSVGTVFADNSIQNTTKNISSVKTVNSYKNTIEIDGALYNGGHQQGFTLNFDTNTMQLKTSVKQTNNAIHPIFGNNVYARIELYDKNNDLKRAFSITGNDKIDKVNSELNNTRFSYGDRIKIYHAEPNRAHIFGNVKYGDPSYSTSMNANVLNNNLFEIRTYGLKQIKRPNILSNQIILSGKKYTSARQSFRMRFNMDSHKIEVDKFGLENAKLNNRFKGREYIKVDLLRNNNVVDSVSLNGDDKVNEALRLENMTLNVGDEIRIYHAEAGSQFKVIGDVEGATQQNMQNGVNKKTMTFRLTENGLSEVN